MIYITSEGNLFTSFCISVAGTASFHQLTVTALIQFSIQSFLFLLVNFNLFAIKKKQKKQKKTKKQCCRTVFVCHINCRIVSVLFGVCPVCSRNPFPVDLKLIRQAV